MLANGTDGNNGLTKFSITQVNQMAGRSSQTSGLCTAHVYLQFYTANLDVDNGMQFLKDQEPEAAQDDGPFIFRFGFYELEKHPKIKQ